jgi:ubiquinone/menaquinone biosynthesis C-methylase UbiE
MMPHRFTGDFSRLESEERKRILPPTRVLQMMSLQQGDTLLDFGCGIGYFSIPALDAVGENGTVIAVDVSREMLQELRKRAGSRKNLIIVHADSLEGLTADIILLSMVLHEVDDPKGFLRTCRASLNPSGRVVVIDWQKMDTGSLGPPVEERLAKEEVLQYTQMRYREHVLHKLIYFLEFFSDEQKKVCADL